MASLASALETDLEDALDDVENDEDEQFPKPVNKGASGVYFIIQNGYFTITHYPAYNDCKVTMSQKCGVCMASINMYARPFVIRWGSARGLAQCVFVKGGEGDVDNTI